MKKTNSPSGTALSAHIILQDDNHFASLVPKLSITLIELMDEKLWISVAKKTSINLLLPLFILTICLSAYQFYFKDFTSPSG